MKRIHEYAAMIPGQDEMIPDAHVYLIGKADSGDLTLVDAGLVGKGSRKVAALEQNGIPLTHIKRIIMTHTHMDHIGCLREILEALPQAEVWVHREEGEPLEAGDERTVYGMEMFRTMCQTQYGLAPGAFRFSVDRKLEDGETLTLGGTSWTVLHIPGHSAGSIGLYESREKILIPGDVVYADYAIGRYDLHGADATALRASLFRLAELEVNILLPGHNRIMEGLPNGYLRKTVQQWEPHLRR